MCSVYLRLTVPNFPAPPLNDENEIPFEILQQVKVSGKMVYKPKQDVIVLRFRAKDLEFNSERSEVSITKLLKRLGFLLG